MCSGHFPKITAKKHFPPFLLHLERGSLKLGIMIWALLFEHSHESGHLVHAAIGGEWVRILTEPPANAYSFFHRQLILGLSNAISHWVEAEIDKRWKASQEKNPERNSLFQDVSLVSEWVRDSVAMACLSMGTALTSLAADTGWELCCELLM